MLESEFMQNVTSRLATLYVSLGRMDDIESIRFNRLRGHVPLAANIY